ncbi:MAG TPA: addiction module protein [Pirellulales bacterium]|nr:addiction module protein [Pirellulales bacterium]
MQTADLVQQLMALPLPDRVTVAQALWQSIDEGLAPDVADDPKETIQTALRRDAELTSGAASGRTHEEVMDAVRRALACG